MGATLNSWLVLLANIAVGNVFVMKRVGYKKVLGLEFEYDDGWYREEF